MIEKKTQIIIEFLDYQLFDIKNVNWSKNSIVKKRKSEGVIKKYKIDKHEVLNICRQEFFIKFNKQEVLNKVEQEGKTFKKE